MDYTAINLFVLDSTQSVNVTHRKISVDDFSCSSEEIQDVSSVDLNC